MRYHCYTCGKSVSSELPGDSVIRAVLVCPECIEAAAVIFPTKETPVTDANEDDVVEVSEGEDTEVPETPLVDRGPLPTVCRMVHYVAYGTPGGEYTAGAHRAAIITEVPDDPDAKKLRQVGLLICNPTGIHFREFVSQDELKKKPGTWHWPEQVPNPK